MTQRDSSLISQRGTAGPAPGTPAIVDVVARSMPDGSVEFTHEWRWQDGSPGGNGSIGIPARKPSEPGTPIHFHLRDETRPSKGLDFTDDSDGAMWVRRNSCPPENQKCVDAQIPMAQMVRSPNLLKVFDENSEECTLHYRLRFKDRAGNAESYDPDITNGGTNRA
jgi:hypothetical protein